MLSFLRQLINNIILSLGIGNFNISMTAYPIWDIELTAYKPKPKGYPDHPVTLGDYLKKKRIDENLSKEQVCKDLDIYMSTRIRWEENMIEPRGESVEKLKAYLKIK
jgi:ribosome-binding protein aMBF1 (putative translation factor)